jgi:transposase
MAEIRDLAPEFVEALFHRFDAHALTEEDRPIVRAMMEGYVLLGHAVKEKNGKIQKLLRMIFGTKTEKAYAVLHTPPQPKGEKATPRGHGRNGVDAYAGGTKVTVSHTLNAGDRCPGCEKGRVYPTAPGVIVRVTGGAPLAATSFELEKLRCNCCGEVFTAKPPDEGSEKYDATAGAMIALMKYGAGVPFNRLEQLQEAMGVPLPASTQWDIAEKTAKPAHPAYKELIRQAAQGEIIHNDDTMMKILTSVNDKEGRNGTFTTGMLAVTEERKIALFFTGHNHAGENLTDVLKERNAGLDPPVQMCDALSRNTSKEFETILAHCMSHARRNFVDVADNFPDECRHVIEILAKVYKYDAIAKEQKMTPFRRREYHQAESGPLMEKLREWMNVQFEEKKTEPNSGLGKAFSYMLKHWEPLTLFLRVPGAPLDNNLCEQVLKKAILHRKNSYFYRTPHGAYIGDLFMSVIHTCRLSKINPFDYLVTLQKHPHEVFKNPQNWLPWNYEAAVTALSL